MVTEIQTQVLKKYKNELAEFSKHIAKYCKGDIALTDKLTILPHLLLQSGIETALIKALNGSNTYFISDMETPL